MISVSYEEIYSRFLSKVEAYELTILLEADANNMMNEWLKSVKSIPRVRKMFSTLTLEETYSELKFLMKNSQGDDISDKDFVIEIFGIGIAWKWVTPKYYSILNASQMISGKEVKFYSQANHMDALEKMFKGSRAELFGTIRDYGVLYNSYLSDV